MSAAISAASMHESLPISRVWRRLGQNLYKTSSYIMCDVFPARQSDGVAALEVVMPPKGLPTLDLDVRIINERGRYGFMAMFNAEQYDPAGVEALLRDVQHLIMSISAEPDRPLPYYLDAAQVEVP